MALEILRRRRREKTLDLKISTAPRPHFSASSSQSSKLCLCQMQHLPWGYRARKLSNTKAQWVIHSPFYQILRPAKNTEDSIWRRAQRPVCPDLISPHSSVCPAHRVPLTHSPGVMLLNAPMGAPWGHLQKGRCQAPWPIPAWSPRLPSGPWPGQTSVSQAGGAAPSFSSQCWPGSQGGPCGLPATFLLGSLHHWLLPFLHNW